MSTGLLDTSAWVPMTRSPVASASPADIDLFPSGTFMNTDSSSALRPDAGHVQLFMLFRDVALVTFGWCCEVRASGERSD